MYVCMYVAGGDYFMLLILLYLLAGWFCDCVLKCMYVCMYD